MHALCADPGSELIAMGPKLVAPGVLYLAALEGRGIEATNLTLLRDDDFAARAAAAGMDYTWPAAGAATAGPAANSSSWPGWLVAVVVLVCVFMAAALVAFVVIRRRRKRGLRQDDKKEFVEGLNVSEEGSTGSCNWCPKESWWLAGSRSTSRDADVKVSSSGSRRYGSSGNASSQGERFNLGAGEQAKLRGNIAGAGVGSEWQVGAVIGGNGLARRGNAGQVTSETEDVDPLSDQSGGPESRRLGPNTPHPHTSAGSVATRASMPSSPSSGAVTPLESGASSRGSPGGGVHHHNTGWQRVHYAISSMSVKLQRRRLNLLTGSGSVVDTPAGGRSSGWQLQQEEPRQQGQVEKQQELVQRRQTKRADTSPGQGLAGTHNACLLESDDSAPSAVGSSPPSPLNRDVRPRGTSIVQAPGSNCVDPGRLGRDIQLLEVVGCGSFGTVYRAAWRGKTVAVKLVHVPKSSGELLHGLRDKGEGKAIADQLREESNYSQDKAERMALIEAVVSMSMQHPNIVRVFRYEVHPLAGDALGTGVGAVGNWLRTGARPATGAAEQEQLEDDSLGWELRLVMEYCSQVRSSNGGAHECDINFWSGLV